MGSQSHTRTGDRQQRRSCDKNGVWVDSHDHVRSSSGSTASYSEEGGVVSGGTGPSQSQSQERDRGRSSSSSSHHSDCGSIEEEEVDAAVSPMTAAPCSSSSPLDTFGGDNCHLVVIDVNFFPSYKEVPDFPQRLREFLRKKAGMV